MENDNVNIFNVTQIFNLSLVGKHFNGTYSERRFVNETIGYRDKVIIDLPNDVFDKLKKPLHDVLRKNDIQYSCLVWKKDKIELLVEFPARKTYTFGDGTWKIQQVFVRDREICFTVERLTFSSGKNSDIIHPDLNMLQQAPFQLHDIFLSCKEMFRMATLILIVVVNLISIFLEFSYKVLQLVPSVIESLMPLFITVVNAITKCVGGFYLLIVALRNGPQHPRPNANDQFRNEFLAVEHNPTQRFNMRKNKQRTHFSDLN